MLQLLEKWHTKNYLGERVPDLIHKLSRDLWVNKENQRNYHTG
jgi:hypothetical protein